MSGVQMSGDVTLSIGDTTAHFHDGIRLTNVSHVFFVVLAAAGASTIVSMLPVFVMVRFERMWLGRVLALAVGLIAGGVIANSKQAMLVSTVLAAEGVAFGAVGVWGGLYWTKRNTHSMEEDELEFWNGSDCTDDPDSKHRRHKINIIISVFALSEIVEGFGIGLSFGAGEELGDTLSFAMLLESMPKGMLLGLLLVRRIGKTNTGLICAVAHAAQPFAAAGAFYFEAAFKAYMPFCLGSAAGGMGVFLALEVIPTAARASASYLHVLTIAVISGGLLLAYLHVVHNRDIVVTG
jgi:zinc transporter ZupT